MQMPLSPHDSIMGGIKIDRDPNGDLEQVATEMSSPFDTVSGYERRASTFDNGYMAYETVPSSASSAPDNALAGGERRDSTFADSFVAGIPTSQGSASNTVGGTSTASAACAILSSDEPSSDAWTGDEDFMPPSARRRHREQRLTKRKAVIAFQTALPMSPYPQPDQPSTLKERPTSLRSSRASRFQPTRIEVWRVPSRKQSEKPAESEKSAESGPSDADDEDDSGGS
ncbi:hypothetical protein LTR08_003975 [Meristemomyces frigidus]|nr:hypothetical protein LTR08_003975 [Meristemomyces frigidus]